jgi:dienelactone hydrolase
MMIRSFSMICLAAAVAVLLPASAFAAEQLPRGVVMESVGVESSPGQSYALYLPSAYTPERKWPVLYAFDPAARGKLPVNLFRAAAERFGYIVVGSNDSRNGLAPAAVVQIIKALWKETHARLSIDDARVYATGFSGGARVANRFASGCGGCVAGVISSGAGFPDDIAPNGSLPYAFFGTVGWDDFNFREMRPLERTLDALGVNASRLVTFYGRHQWCPEEVCAEGIEWMELLAMRRGLRVKDDALVDGALARLSARAEALQRPADTYERYALLKTIAQTFEGLRDVARFRREAAALKQTKEFAAAVADEQRQIDEEQTRARAIVAAGGRLLDDATHDEALTRVRRMLAPWREQAKSAEDSAARRIARRTLAHIYAETLESAQFIYEPRKEFKLAAANLELTAEIYPQVAQTEFELARALALDGRKDRALDALARAFDKGYRDPAAVEREEAFASLRPDKRFRKLLDRMRAEPTSGASGAQEKN